MIVALALTVAFAAGMGFVPQFAGPGYEISLAYGLLLPTILVIASAAELARFEPEPFEAYCRGIANGVLVFVVASMVSLAHGLARGFCDPLTGLLNLLLGPGVGLAVAGAYSAVVFELSRVVGRPRLRSVSRVAFALLGPLGSIGVGLARFYTSPMIFGYDPFVGYFSGTLYDTVIELDRLYTYRVGSAATLFAGFVISLHLTHDARKKLVYQSVGRPGLLMFGVLCAAASMLHMLGGPELGHWHTRASIAEELGSVVEGERCRVVHARAIPPEAAQRFARECEAHVDQVEKWLGVRGPETITAFLFEDARQKARLMGAAGTNIAKPWRAEVYVQGAAFPHRVLGHELVHVIAASAGRGPFRIAGSAGGLLPNPGLIEGVAVAGSPKDEDLSPMEWAKAMKDLNILPPLEKLFALAFLGQSSGTAYTVSGAFVGWVHDKFGAEAVVAWYGGEELPDVTKTSWAELEQAWHAELDKITLPEAARVQAAARFDKPGFFARKCPRLIDGCRDRAADLEELGDTSGAMAELDRALAVDPEHLGLRIDRAETLLFGATPAEAEADLRQIAGTESFPRHVRDRAVRVLGDYAFYRGDVESAKKAYEELLTRTIEQDQLRTFHVKLAACRDEGLRPAVALLLVGPPSRRGDRLAAIELLGALDRERSTDGLAPYLLARARLDAGDFPGAAERLDRALARKLDVPFVKAEALRLRIQVACGLGDGAGAARWLADYGKDPAVSRARYQTSKRLVARCAGVALDSLPSKAADRTD
jgi:tetratricopeptide (TPR) repeat protein